GKHKTIHNSPYSSDEFQMWPSHNITPIPRASLGNNVNTETYGTEMPMPDRVKPSNGLVSTQQSLSTNSHRDVF
ncbi:mucin-2 isoform X2, partial [Tachysurus ichikawai]